MTTLQLLLALGLVKSCIMPPYLACVVKSDNSDCATLYDVHDIKDGVMGDDHDDDIM